MRRTLASRLPDHVTLGASGITVSPMGVGTNRWGSGGAARAELRPVYEAALEAGINLFDTAEIYGRGGSERNLGRCLAATDGKPVILTKFFPMPWRLRKAALVSALRGSLDRLGLPAIDVYLVHFPTPLVPPETWAEGLADAVEAGLVRAVGVSNYSAAQMRRACAVLRARGIPLACNEVEFSLLNREAERNGVLELCRELGVTLIAYRPLALGYLSAPGPYDRPAQVALNWVLCKGALPVPGATSVRHLRENAGALGWSLTVAPGRGARRSRRALLIRFRTGDRTGYRLVGTLSRRPRTASRASPCQSR